MFINMEASSLKLPECVFPGIKCSDQRTTMKFIRDIRKVKMPSDVAGHLSYCEAAIQWQCSDGGQGEP